MGFQWNGSLAASFPADLTLKCAPSCIGLSKDGHKAVSAILVAASAFWLSACTHEAAGWKRVGGFPIDAQQLEAARLACRGQVEMAAAQGQSRSTVGAPFGMDAQDNRIFVGCMAEKGYLPQ